MGKPTPGPWTVSTNATGYGRVSDCRYQIDSEELCVAIIVTDVPELENEANARLIAAAPELLDFAKSTFNSTNCTCKFLGYVGKEPPCGRCQLGALIAKAEGRS